MKKALVKTETLIPEILHEYTFGKKTPAKIILETLQQSNIDFDSLCEHHQMMSHDTDCLKISRRFFFRFTDQTWSFTFFPSTSMVFTLKSIPVRRQRGGKGNAGTELNTTHRNKDTPTYIVGCIGRSQTPTKCSHPHVWRRPYRGLLISLGFSNHFFQVD